MIAVHPPKAHAAKYWAASCHPIGTFRTLGWIVIPTEFALKFVESRAFVTSNIIGATSLAQLKENIDAHDIDAHDIEWTDDMEVVPWDGNRGSVNT